MAEINRAEELTPEEEQIIDADKEEPSQELIPEEKDSTSAEERPASEEKGLESGEDLGQQEEKEEFNYEARREEIEVRAGERMEKYRKLMEEIFKRHPDDGGGAASYGNQLRKALEKKQKNRVANLKNIETVKPEDAFSYEERLALALEQKRNEIIGDKNQEVADLKEKRQQDREKKISEI